MPFRATIKDKEIYFPAMRTAIHWQEWKESHEGAHILIEEMKPTRSLSQNAYYWKYLEIIGGETGENPDDLHEFLRRKLLPPQFKTIRGEELKLPRSTTALDKTEFSEYLDRIAALTNVP